MDMLAKPYVHPAMGRDVIKLKTQVEERNAAAKTRDVLLFHSFVTLSFEKDQLWQCAQASNAQASVPPVPSTTAPQPSQDLGPVINHLIKDVPFCKNMVRLVLKDLDRAKFVTMSNFERRLLPLPQPTTGISTIDLSRVST